MLPSGSVTGAPKVRAMDLIAELEAERRGLYTGAFGYLAHDGTLEGPDLSGLGYLLEWTALPVVASGGVASLDDLRALARLPLAGVIVGKALVEGRFSVEEALAACAPSA